MYVCMYVCICRCMCMYVCMYVCMCAWARQALRAHHAYIHIYTALACGIDRPVCICMYTYVYVCIRMYMSRAQELKSCKKTPTAGPQPSTLNPQPSIQNPNGRLAYPTPQSLNRSPIPAPSTPCGYYTRRQEPAAVPGLLTRLCLHERAARPGESCQGQIRDRVGTD